MKVRREPPDLRRNAQPNVAAAHFWKADRRIAAVHFVLHVLFPAANLFLRPTQIAVPFQGVHAEIEVHVKNEGGLGHGSLSREEVGERWQSWRRIVMVIGIDLQSAALPK